MKGQPYRVWNALPRSVRERVSGTKAFDLLERGNEWLWRTDWYLNRQYEFTWVSVEVNGIETRLYVPMEKRPWWREYERCGCHEPLTSKTFVEAIDEGDTVWDMGSRFGYFSTLAAVANGSAEDVHVFEHSVSNWRVVEENNRARFDGRMNVNRLSVGGDTAESVRDYARENGVPQVVKMDIEGSELAAVRALEPLIEATTPTLLIEVHPPFIAERGNGTDDDLYRLLETHYDDVRMSFDFRDPDGAWKPAADLWSDRDAERGRESSDADLYQLYCA